ncbi:MAG: tRNA (N6-isopentenyl adenosine(37)-C2)-methylthiotransferase MiaB [Candidatus Omnitrophica bacterium]|nr:tRNA (N6-isopentenyl adenosine(37)-C2)-methylthiotransferase MiaB [Candidatus Omnitrophota bacterium]
MKKIFIRTFGCQMNVRDSEFVAGMLLENGFELVDSVEKADVVLFNSCSVRQHAEDRLFSNIGDLARLKKKKRDLVIVRMGCTAQKYKDKAIDRSPLLDIVCGPGNEADLAGILKDFMENRCAIVAVDKVNEKRPEIFSIYRENDFKAYVSIGEGCDNYCSYCIVPYVRGKERSRDAKDVIREVEELAARGFKEVTLLGQNVNSYGKAVRPSGRQAVNFVKLLERINKINGIERIRFMTSHPKDVHTELFKAMRDLEKVCEHLHLPLQSGSDRILKLMNRGYTAKRYLKLVEDYRKIVCGGSLTTDIIVGFSSETEADFKKTLSVMRSIEFDSAFTFKYSPRPPAKSAFLKDDVPAAAKEKRLQSIIGLQVASSKKRNESLIGSVVEVLVDGRNKKDEKSLSGRTRTNKAVIFEGDRSLVGSLLNIEIRSATSFALRGRIEAGSSTFLSPTRQAVS